MSVELERLQQEVAETRTVAESAITLINGLSQQIRDLQNDPAALAALADELDSLQQSLGDAISANTPSDPPADEPSEPAEPPADPVA